MIKMAVNKIVYGNKTLIDLTADTVDATKILAGYKAHDKAGNVITGTFLQGYPASFTMEFGIQDSSGNDITDHSSNKLTGQYIYEMK